MTKAPHLICKWFILSNRITQILSSKDASVILFVNTIRAKQFQNANYSLIYGADGFSEDLHRTRWAAIYFIGSNILWILICIFLNIIRVFKIVILCNLWLSINNYNFLYKYNRGNFLRGSKFNIYWMSWLNS